MNEAVVKFIFFYSISNWLITSSVVTLYSAKEINIGAEKIIAPVLQMKTNSDLENHQLSELRDRLLPMLMNGQVTGKDTEEENFSRAAEPEVEYGKKGR